MEDPEAGRCTSEGESESDFDAYPSRLREIFHHTERAWPEHARVINKETTGKKSCILQELAGSLHSVERRITVRIGTGDRVSIPVSLLPFTF